MNRSAVFYRGTTVSTTDNAPNSITTPPTGQTNASGGIEGAPFNIPETYKDAGSCALVLACVATVGGTSTVTVNIWIADTTSNSWVQLVNALTITEKTAQTVSVLRGNDWNVFVQVTAVANTPSGLVGFIMPQP